MKGIEKLREKLPDYQGKIIFKFLIVAILVFLGSILVQLLVDSLPRIFKKNEILQIIAPFTPLIGSLTILTIGLTLVYSFWRTRNKKLSEFGELGYQKAFKFVVSGIPMVISIIIHSFIPTDFIVPFEDNQSITSYLANPISNIFFNYSLVLLTSRVILFLLFTGLGITVILKALMIFGIDNMALVYVYFPKESTLQNHEIYSVLRHPTYHGLTLILIGCIFLRFSVYSMAYLLIFLIGINLHLKFVEEKELIERFGDGYKQYKEAVPAFFVRFKDFKKYLAFIF